MGLRGGKRSLETMTLDEGKAGAKKSSWAAAEKRTAKRLKAKKSSKKM